MGLYIASFVAGMLTILAPCILPVLPVILGGGFAAGQVKKILVICTSFIVSIIVFTLLIKVSTVCTGVNPALWNYISGGILIVFGLFYIFPQIREKIALHTGIYKIQNTVGNHNNSLRGNMVLGAALGPVFSSCSPTYAIIIALVLPVSLIQGSISIFFYACGLGLMLFLVARWGSTLVKKLQWASNPRGWFKKCIGMLIVLTGVAIVADYTKVIQTKILDRGWYTDIGSREQMITKSLFDINEITTPQDNTDNTQQDVDTSLFNTNTKAPNFVGLGPWINTTGFNTIQDLSGKVVLLNFWTYSCTNCINVVTHLNQRYQKYADDGLVVIGIHAPEFEFEQEPKNVIQALKQSNITYPVVLDNDFMTRKAYKNRYRPTIYIIDTRGNIRYTHAGEGSYRNTEMLIQALIKEVPGYVSDNEQIDTEIIKAPNDKQTAKTYLGLQRRALYPIQKQAYFLEENTSIPNTRGLQGERKSDEEKATLQAGMGSVRLQYNAADVTLVGGTARGEVQASVYLDGVLYKKIPIKEFGAYTLIQGAEVGNHSLEVKFNTPGIEIYTFTFG